MSEALLGPTTAVALEATAVVLAVAYLVLAAREHIACWACAFVSTAIYIVLFYDVALLSESLLNVYYLLMAVYGFQQWRGGGGDHRALAISDRPLAWHGRAIVLTALPVPVLGWLMANGFGADYAYLDAFTTCFAVFATWLVTQKILENWLYWFVIDAVSIYLYLAKGLTLTAMLFALYLVLIVFGYRRWRREFHAVASPA